MGRIISIGRCATIAGALMIGIANAGETPPVPGLALPQADAKRGRELYVSKACVACHAIKGVGGQNAAPLDASTMDPSGNPFEFFARMWLGTKPMIAMQEDKMGGQVELTAAELADIVTFIHDEAMQEGFSNQEIPDNIEDLIEAD